MCELRKFIVLLPILLLAISLSVQGIPEGASTYQFKEKGMFNSTEVSYGHFLGYGNLNEFSITHVVGHQFNRYLGIGAGTGYQVHFSPYGMLSIIPVFVEARGYLTDKKVAPMYKGGIGYGFVVPIADRASFNGPLQFRNAFGVRIGERAGVNTTILLGFDIDLFFYKDYFSLEPMVLDDRKIVLSVGLVF